MTTDQGLLFGLLAVMLALFVWGRIRYDVVALGTLVVATFAGLVPADAAFAGFGNTAVITVALVLTISAGLTRSGAVAVLGKQLADGTDRVTRHIALVGGIGAVLSAFMNNVAALALLMPLDMQAARRARRPAGLTLMPLAFATILGGLVTLIGTPPNILIAEFRGREMGTPFRMFDFAPVGLLAAAAGLAFVALVGWRLVPRRDDDARGAGASAGDAFLAELVVSPGSGAIGRTVPEIEAEGDRAGLSILRLVRDERRINGAALATKLREGDVLMVEATSDGIEEFRVSMKLDFVGGKAAAMAEAGSRGLVVTEAIVTEGARIAGRSAQALGLGWRRRTILVGISRHGRRISRALRRERIRPGDVLLLLTPEEEAAEVIDWLGCLPVGDRSLSVTDTSRILPAVGLFAAAILAATLGLTSLPVAFGAVVLGYLAFRVLPLAELYAHIHWPVIVLLGALIPIGIAFETTGGAGLIASSLVAATDGMPPWVALTLLMVVTMTLSDLLNNAATAVLAAPVAVDVANRLGTSADPFLMAVAVAASCAFLTPIGHQNNTLVMGAGKYRFGDYWRMGLPLEALIVAVSIPAILYFWPM
ncbi:MAG: SLC13 family permease [Rhodobacteraceae bacterium]|nr:SLC13 family permease [Paracoccaceae bacterium]